MTNALGVCLLAISLFCCTNLSLARQVPKECNKGPQYWCQSLKQGAECGAVGHCIATVWEKQHQDVTSNHVSEKFVRLFRQLKDVKDMINEDYLSTRVSAACRDIPYAEATRICKDNTARLDKYLMHLLTSETSAETMCRVVGMCNNMKLDNIMLKEAKEQKKAKETLVGGSHCTWGPSYWCSNFSTSRECQATSHCVQRIWPASAAPDDTDSICKICTDMVKQARDQLQSNETQEELKEVFEGSCELIRIKIVRKECMKLADDFVPELVETLASQMNPQTVCSVAGLCNNEKIDKLLEEYNTQLQLREGCNNCHHTVGVLRRRFDATTYDDFLVGLLRMCGKMDSLSDSCSMLVFKYYENILAAVKKDLSPMGVCHLSGQCAYKFHAHDEFDLPDVRIEELTANDDVPCQFCEQLVVHLRDVLVANTTELQFQKVLKGLCKQTGEFKTECLHLVDEYYTVFYNYLVTDLKPAAICAMMGICGKPTDAPVAPLLPHELTVKAITPPSKLIGAEEAMIARVPVASKQANVRILGAEPVAPLPIERMFVATPQSKPVCSFCQYFLHYLQVELSDINTEEKIKAAVEKACDKLPQSVDGECRQFVTEYGPAVIALLVQEIDPSSVCPALGLCPQTQQVRRVAINSEKSNCPLCLFAVEQLETMLKNNRSEASIRTALDSLCTHLSQKLRTECTDFVDTYTNQLVEMLVADLNAQEICVFLKLCTDNVADPLKVTSSIDKYHDKPQLRGDRNNFRKGSMLPKYMLEKDGDIETNEIPDNTVGGRPVNIAPVRSSFCAVCEFAMVQIDNQIKDKGNEDEIKKIVNGVCASLPKTLEAECHSFVDKYEDMVISLLVQELDPNEVCKELKLCNQIDKTTATVTDNQYMVYRQPQSPVSDSSVCVMCEFVMTQIDAEIQDKHNEDEIKKVVHNVCKKMPKSVTKECDQFVDKYADLVVSLLAQKLDPKTVCKELKLCSQLDQMTAVKESMLDCAVCETVVVAVKKVLSNDKVDRNIVHIVEKSCGLLPAKYSARCHTMMEIYGDSVIRLIEDYGTRGVCQKIGLCDARDAAYVHMYKENRN